MKKSLLAILAIIIMVSGCQKKENNSSVAPPHLEKRGNVTQLIVEGKPWLVLGCELGNSTSSSR
jgi:nitrous oxide reductase accessory protein NosL